MPATDKRRSREDRGELQERRLDRHVAEVRGRSEEDHSDRRKVGDWGIKCEGLAGFAARPRLHAEIG